MQVTTEGGFDAAMEAPYIYAAIDALAVRAGKWAERRQRLLQEASPDELAMPSPEAAAAAAITAVKEVHLHVCCYTRSCQPQKTVHWQPITQQLMGVLAIASMERTPHTHVARYTHDRCGCFPLKRRHFPASCCRCFV